LGITNEHKHFTLEGMIISPAYKCLSLQHLLDKNYDFAPFCLLTNFKFATDYHIEGDEVDVDKFIKYESNAYINDVFGTKICLLHPSSHPLTKYNIKKTNVIMKEALSEDAFEKSETPIIMQVDDQDFSQIFLSGNVPVDQMGLAAYKFSVFQVPHHRHRPTLTAKICELFPSQEHIENAAKLMALYNYMHTLEAEISLLDDNHPLYEMAKAFNSYFMIKKKQGFK